MEEVDGKRVDMTLREAMESIAEGLDRVLNGTGEGPRTNGFVLIVHPYGDRSGMSTMVSNDATPDQVVEIFRAYVRVEVEKKGEGDERKVDVG